MPDDSQQIQPLLSTEAYALLQTVVPSDSWNGGHRISPLTPRSVGRSRYRQVLLTAVPLASADLVSICFSYLLGTVLTSWALGSAYHRGIVNNLSAYCLCHLVAGHFLGLFPATGINPVRELRSLLTAVFSSLILLVAINGLVGEVTANELLTIAITIPIVLLVAPVLRFSTRKLFSRFRWWGETVIVVGGGRQGRLVYEFLRKQPQRGLKPIGIIDANPNEYWLAEKSEPYEFLGTTSELVSICRTHDCHWIIAAVADKSEEEVVEILTQGSLIPNLIVLNNSIMMPSMWVDPFDAAGLVGFHVRDQLLFPLQRLLKRFIDVFLSLTIAIALSPVLLTIFVWIKINSKGGSVLFRQMRISRGSKRFYALKFRTMVPNAQEILANYLVENPAAMIEWKRDLKLKNDPRVIPGIGTFLRRTSLDELPQLWNVLVGDMSLVGPRPIVAEEIEKYKEFYPLYHRVRPGMTGLWQVSGRNNTSYNDRVRLDTYYVRNWSPWLDYYILLRTVRTVFLREGSY